MSIVTPEVYSYKDTQSIFPYGEAMMNDGLVVRDAVDGFGLMTDGFLWELEAIWIGSQSAISTVWSALAGASSLSTSWSPIVGVTVTNWTASTVFGEMPPG